MSNKNKKREGVVYSTDPDFNYHRKESEEEMDGKDSDLRIWLEKNQRGGKKATIIRGFAGPAAELLGLAKQLKSKLGTGGSVKGSEVIIQGDKREKVLDILSKLGYKAKKAGG